MTENHIPAQSSVLSTQHSWFALEVEFAPAAEEVISWALWSLGTIGIETVAETGDQLTLAAYFEAAPDLEQARALLRAALASAELPPDGLRRVAAREVPGEDWLRRWKEGYEPFAVGERFLITPSWKEPDEAARRGRIMLRLDPGMAFGTGTHETTRLCLQALETYWRGGSLLDVGAGTGILAIAAARLRPEAYISACDIDPNAVSVALENAQLNDATQIDFRVGSVGDYRGRRFSLVVANLTIDAIEPILGPLGTAVEPGGVLILSGVLVEQVSDLCALLPAAGLAELGKTVMGEWALVACTPG